MIHKFIADVHLGRLARLLRLLGFDTAYRNDYPKNELWETGRQQDRIILSRDVSFQKLADVKSCIIASQDSLQQLKQVVDHFNLQEEFHPFTRCIVCNGILQPVAKENIVHLLEKNTMQFFSEFWQCDYCGRIYWKGSHYERILKTIAGVMF